MTSERPTARSTPREAWICAALVALVVVVYAPVRSFDFVSYDDPAYVSDNPHVTGGLTWDAVRWAFTSAHAANWHPLTWLSHMLDAQILGAGAAGPHVVNALLHAANTVLVFDVLRRTTGAVGRSAFVAALFAVHPLHVESVAWISERKDVLSTLFWMLTLEAYVAYVRRPGARRYALVLLAFVAGLMAKPMLVTLPFALFLLDRWPLGRWTDAASARRLVVEKIPLLVLSAASCVVTWIAQRRGDAVADFVSDPVRDRVVNALDSYVLYAWKMLAPTGLAPRYVHERPLPLWKGALAAAALAAVTVAAVRQARRRPWFLFGWLWFLGTLVPVVGLVQVGMQSMADRYTYVPLVGLFVVVAWGGAASLDAERRRAPAVVCACAATLACAVLARRQVEVWKDGETLWRHAVAVAPEVSDSHECLGAELCLQRRFAEAAAEFGEAARIRPDAAQTLGNLGYALMKSGRLDAAERNLREAVRLDPSLPDPHENLGFALRSTGRLEEAVAQFREALRLRPEFAAAHRDLAGVLEERGFLDDARREYAEASRIDPGDADARAGLERLTGRPR